MPTPDAPQPMRRLSLADQVRSLATILFEEFDVPFHFFSGEDGKELSSGNPAQPTREPESARLDPGWVLTFGKVEQAGAIAVPGGYRLALSLHEDGRPGLVACGYKGALARPHPEALREETVRMEKWVRAVFDRLRQARQTTAHHRAEPPKPTATPDAWEVIVRLEQLMRVQKTHKEPVKNRRRVLRAAAELVPAQSLIFVPMKGDESVICVGDELLSTWDCTQLAASLFRSRDWEETGFLLLNDAGTMNSAVRFPQVANLLGFPVLDGGPVGWLIAINKQAGPTASAAPAGNPPRVSGSTGAGAPDGQAAAAIARPAIAPFRRADAAKLAPFASLLGYHARAYQSYIHLRELLVGLTRALTAAIDAKDSYTYGHSERVARIAVELGRELHLPEEDLSDIYLAGLLHDIGKIGIRDEVLGKSGPLTSEEYEHIKQHVKIGYRILSGLDSISHLLPGVLYHHERYDGKGYPEGLKGTAIPFIARILAVADSYDAMSTSRPYRVALPSEKVEQILIQGADLQWEQAVIDAFVRCKDRIHAIRQRGVGESLCGALDDVLNKGTGRNSLSSVMSILVN